MSLEFLKNYKKILPF